MADYACVGSRKRGGYFAETSLVYFYADIYYMSDSVKKKTQRLKIKTSLLTPAPRINLHEEPILSLGIDEIESIQPAVQAPSTVLEPEVLAPSTLLEPTILETENPSIDYCKLYDELNEEIKNKQINIKLK
jgi:hypothetical protein